MIKESYYYLQDFSELLPFLVVQAARLKKIQYCQLTPNVFCVCDAGSDPLHACSALFICQFYSDGSLCMVGCSNWCRLCKSIFSVILYLYEFTYLHYSLFAYLVNASKVLFSVVHVLLTERV